MDVSGIPQGGGETGGVSGSDNEAETSNVATDNTTKSTTSGTTYASSVTVSDAEGKKQITVNVTIVLEGDPYLDPPPELVAAAEELGFEGNPWMKVTAYVAFVMAMLLMAYEKMQESFLEGQIELDAMVVIKETGELEGKLAWNRAQKEAEEYMASAIISGVSFGLQVVSIGGTAMARKGATEQYNTRYGQKGAMDNYQRDGSGNVVKDDNGVPKLQDGADPNKQGTLYNNIQKNGAKIDKINKDATTAGPNDTVSKRQLTKDEQAKVKKIQDENVRLNQEFDDAANNAKTHRLNKVHSDAQSYMMNSMISSQMIGSLEGTATNAVKSVYALKKGKIEQIKAIVDAMRQIINRLMESTIENRRELEQEFAQIIQQLMKWLGDMYKISVSIHG